MEPTCRHTTVSVSSQAAMIGSQWPECSVGYPSEWGGFGEADGPVAPLGVAIHLGRAHLGVEEVGDLARDHAVGIGPGPLFDVPVVPGPYRGQGQVGVVGQLLEALATEARAKNDGKHRDA